MTKKISKVTLRKKPISNGQLSLYLDFYPPITVPSTNRQTRREFLGMYIYAKPKNDFERGFNKSLLLKADVIRGRRQEAIINKEYGFIEKETHNTDFLGFLEDYADKKGHTYKSVFLHFKNFVGGKCAGSQVNKNLCEEFCAYLREGGNIHTKDKESKLSSSTTALYTSHFYNAIHQAYIDKVIPEDYCAGMKIPKAESRQKEYLTLDEVRLMAVSECKFPVLKRAALFSCLTGLRISDIRRLQWENIEKAQDGGHCMRITTQKTKNVATLPLSEDAYRILGEPSKGTVFPGLTDYLTNIILKEWLLGIGITKKITFNSFRHTYYKVGEQVYCRPSEGAIKNFKENICNTVVGYVGSQQKLIEKLNQKISGWASYHKVGEADGAFREMDTFINAMLVELCREVHPSWKYERIIEKYWMDISHNRHCYALVNHRDVRMKQLEDTLLIDYDAVNTDMNPYIDLPYMEMRSKERKIFNVVGVYRSIWNRQNGCCYYCGHPILRDEEKALIEVDPNMTRYAASTP